MMTIWTTMGGSARKLSSCVNFFVWLIFKKRSHELEKKLLNGRDLPKDLALDTDMPGESRSL